MTRRLGLTDLFIRLLLWFPLVIFLPGAATAASFGTYLGEFNGIAAYANGSSGYYAGDNARNYVGGTYTGIKWQCVEFVRRYYLGVYGVDLASYYTGDANTWYGNAVKMGLTAYPDGSSTPPQVGDILAFNGGAAGHIAIVREVGPNYLRVIQQNVTQDSGDVSYTYPLVVSGNYYKVTASSLGAGYSTQGWMRRVAQATDPDITALANTTQAVQWFYVKESGGRWYIVGASSTGSNPAVLYLKSVDTSVTGGIRWKPINNFSAYLDFPAATTNFSSISVSTDGRSVQFGSIVSGQTDPDVSALANTTQTVQWFYVKESGGRWYIVGDSRTGSSSAVLHLKTVDPSVTGGIRWKPINNFNAYLDFPAAPTNFSSISVSPDGRTIQFGPLN